MVLVGGGGSGGNSPGTSLSFYTTLVRSLAFLIPQSYILCIMHNHAQRLAPKLRAQVVEVPVGLSLARKLSLVMDYM